MSRYSQLLTQQRTLFSSGCTRDISFRRQSLKKLGEWIRANDTDIMEALRLDLNKAPFESYATEIGVVLDELRDALRHLRRWSAKKRVKSSVKNFPARCYQYKEPYGVTLILSPWNYPFMLSLCPLIGAVAAGNCAIVKPSAYSPNTSKLIERMLSEVFDPAHAASVLGGREENQALLSEKFDYIFFTGSALVGRTVMEAAARDLTPLTLELGGKSPCIIDDTANLKLAAKRIVWGKLLNAGQTCVAPDYLLVHSSIKDALISHMKEAIRSFLGDAPCNNKEYAKIINQKHFDRLLGLINTLSPILGGEHNAQTLQIAPTLALASWDSAIMQEEIFGPILPVLTFEKLSDVIEPIAKRPKPLALYLFTSSKQNEAFILNNLSFGGGCINDTVVHLSVSSLPFGGVGESGMGNYHGKAGFDTFSHTKSILKKSLLLDVPLRYPPYREIYLKLLKKM